VKKILFISYHFPPQGGAGVQRSLKFVKYLPDFNVLPTVLTSPGSKENRWTPKDETLLKDLPESVEVHRIEWPSATVGEPKREALLTKALESCKELHAKQKFDLIFVTTSPFEDLQFASRASEELSIPWIADLRDPWALDEFQVYRTFLHRRQVKKGMANAFKGASLIIMNTPTAESLLKQQFPHIANSTVVTNITNGFDKEDFNNNVPSTSKNKLFTIVHTGFLHSRAGLKQQEKNLQYKVLGKIDSGVKILPRSHFYLIQALENLVQKKPELKGSIHLVLAGSLNEVDQEIVQNSEIPDLVEMPGYLSHDDSVSTVQNADLLFMPLHDVKKGKKTSIVPGKTYEYLASLNTILGAVPEGDAKDFLQNSGLGITCEPADVEQMVSILEEQIELWKANEHQRKADLEFIYQFERKNLTARLADKIHEVT